MASPRVLSVGQCNYDHGNISRMLGETFAAEVVPASSAGEALDAVRQGGFALVLVNRIFDADGDSGLDFIRRMKSEPAGTPVPVMLVSNFADAQTQAVAAGALVGFGKAALAEPATVARLKELLASA